MPFHKKCFLLLPACVFVSALFAKSNNSSPYIVVAKLVDFVPGISSATYSGYPVKLVIANTSDIKRTFLMMTCSWQDGWQIDNEDFYLNSPECDSNYQGHITLAPGQEKVFFVQVIRKSDYKKRRDSEVRFGFVELTDSLYIVNEKRIFAEVLKENNPEKLYYKSDEYRGAVTYWSNKVVLP